MSSPKDLRFAFSASDHLESVPLRRRIQRLFTPSREEIVKMGLRRCQSHVVRALANGPIYFSEEQGFSGTGFDTLSAEARRKLTRWSKRYHHALEIYKQCRAEKCLADYEDYSLGIVGGILVGLFIGWMADHVGLTGVPAVEGIVRFIVGSGDSLGGMLVILHARMRGRRSRAEVFFIGTLLGMVVGPVSQFLTIFLGLNPYGLIGSVYAIAYSTADNWGGLIAEFTGLVRRERATQAVKSFFAHPFLSSTFIVLIFFIIFDLLARSFGGFSPTTNILAAIEAALLNVSAFIPVIVVWYYGVRIRRPLLKTIDSL